MINSLNLPEYEIIIDYKGMRRPPKLNPKDTKKVNPVWLHHEWQILTYAWLRSQQPQSRRIIAGILIYFNELSPSKQDMRSLQEEVSKNLTDIMPSGSNLQAIKAWQKGTTVPDLTTTFREQRSIRVIPVGDSAIQRSLQNFDNVVLAIENSVLSEMRGQAIKQCWQTTPIDRTCTACDFKTFCPTPARKYDPTVP